MQDVPVSFYLCEEYAAVQCKHCCTASARTSAVVFVCDCIDTFYKHSGNFHRDMKCSYSVIIIAILVRSAAISLSGLRESVKQFADGLPDEVIANAVVINVSWSFCAGIMEAR